MGVIEVYCVNEVFERILKQKIIYSAALVALEWKKSSKELKLLVLK